MNWLEQSKLIAEETRKVMENYTEEELIKLMDTVYGGHDLMGSGPTKVIEILELDDHWHSKIMTAPLIEMPLLINSEEGFTREWARWRLWCGK